MRSVFLHLRARQEEVTAYFNQHYRPSKGQWVNESDTVWICFYSEIAAEMEPDAFLFLRREFDFLPFVSLAVDISGRIPGDSEAASISIDVLSRFYGFAQDDYSYYLWSLDAIKSGAKVNGHGFFDYKGWHKQGLTSH